MFDDDPHGFAVLLLEHYFAIAVAHLSLPVHLVQVEALAVGALVSS